MRSRALSRWEIPFEIIVVPPQSDTVVRVEVDRACEVMWFYMRDVSLDLLVKFRALDNWKSSGFFVKNHLGGGVKWPSFRVGQEFVVYLKNPTREGLRFEGYLDVRESWAIPPRHTHWWRGPRQWWVACGHWKGVRVPVFDVRDLGSLRHSPVKWVYECLECGATE